MQMVGPGTRPRHTSSNRWLAETVEVARVATRVARPHRCSRRPPRRDLPRRRARRPVRLRLRRLLRRRRRGPPRSPPDFYAVWMGAIGARRCAPRSRAQRQDLVGRTGVGDHRRARCAHALAAPRQVSSARGRTVGERVPPAARCGGAAGARRCRERVADHGGSPALVLVVVQSADPRRRLRPLHYQRLPGRPDPHGRARPRPRRRLPDWVDVTGPTYGPYRSAAPARTTRAGSGRCWPICGAGRRSSSCG